MKVRGTNTSLDPSLREMVRLEVKGTLCAHRNGLSHKTREFTVLTGFGLDHNLGVFNNSVDTIERAFAERYFLCKDGDRFRPAFEVGPSNYATTNLHEFRERVMKKMPRLPVMTSQQVVDAYSGHKRRIYQLALHSLEQDSLTKYDARLSAFVKFEKQDISKAPRIINPRSPRFNLRLGKYLKHAEKHFFKAVNKAYGGHTYATVIKGMNNDVVAQVLLQKWKRFDSPVAIGLDASKFDMHVSVPALMYEHSFYQALFPGNKELKWLLSQQLHNKGTARADDGVVKFSMTGTRCSGDLNTSLGNCLIMCALVWEYATERGVTVELANNGDDCVVFLDKTNEPHFTDGLESWFKTKGFSMAVEPTVDVFEQVEFCQARPVQLGTGWRMVRNVVSCLKKDPICLLSIPNQKVYEKWLYAVGECGGILCSGVPVLQHFYNVMLNHGTKCSEGMKKEIFKNRSVLYQLQSLTAGDITPSARVSFYYAFGITPDWQIEMEKHFESMVVTELCHDAIERSALVIQPGNNIITEIE